MAPHDEASGVPLGYFDAMYAEDDDPWGFDSAWYERRKYALTLALLPRHRYRRALEPGCSIGSLTELLAARCDELIAFDFHESSVERARRRLSDRSNVEVRQEVFPRFWPDDGGDLVVWSEVAYYLGDDGARAALDGLDRWLEPGGDLIAVHFTGETDYPRSGRSIGTWLDGVPWLELRTRCVDESFDARVWTRTT